MKTIFLLLCLLLLTRTQLVAQPAWTASDKQQLLANLRRTQAEVTAETARLTPAQWNFREGTGKWTIGQVLEHLTMWELITLSDARYALWMGPNTKVAALCRSDSAATSFIYEQTPHVSPDHTIPTGLVPGANNLTIFNGKCDEIIRQIEQNEVDFRQHVRLGKDNGSHRTLAQLYIIQYGHVDRHLRQIRRIKQQPGFLKL